MNKGDLPRKLKLPSHVMEFHCAQCGECCTDKWRISVDAVSYDKLYNKIAESGRQEELNDNVSLDSKGLKIRFNSKGKCPYLSDNNLCNIQLELGESYLLDICKVYPRNIFSSQDTLEFSLFLTCKAAAKTLQRGPITFIESYLPILDSNNMPFSFIKPNNYKHYYPDKPLLKNSQLPYHQLEDKFIELMQDRRYTVSQRLVTLGHLLSQLIAENLFLVDDMIKGCKSILTNNQSFSEEPNLNYYLKQFYRMSNTFLKKFPSLESSKLLRSILMALTSDGLQPTGSGGRLICSEAEPPNPSCYKQMLDQSYRPVLSTLEPILENYMVNYILSKHFYLKPLHFAYYRMAFVFATITAFSLGYSILTTQPISQQTTLQSIYDVESIFYSSWFYPYISFIEGGKDPLRIIRNGLLLAHI